MFTADQLVAHAIGDYVIQSDWMAREKTRRTMAAVLHAISYAAPFALLMPRPSLWAMLVIIVTHAAIDRWRLARYLIHAKEVLFGDRRWGAEIPVLGYDSEKPAWMAVGLFIVADNVLHIVINAAALRWL